MPVEIEDPSGSVFGARLADGGAPIQMHERAKVLRAFVHFICRDVRELLELGHICTGGECDIYLACSGTPRLRLDGAPLSNQSLRVGQVTYQIVGVMPRTFAYPVASPKPTELYVPVQIRAEDRSRAGVSAPPTAASPVSAPAPEAVAARAVGARGVRTKRRRAPAP